MQIVNPFQPTPQTIPALGRMYMDTVNGNFTAPLTGNYLVLMIGGGGGGGGGGGVSATAGAIGCAGGAGQGGGLKFAIMALVKGTVYPYVIGTGGPGGAGGLATPTDGAQGTAGSQTTFNGQQSLQGEPGWGGPSVQVASNGAVRNAGNGSGMSGALGGQGLKVQGGGQAGADGIGPGDGGGGGGGGTSTGAAQAGGAGGKGHDGMILILW